MDAIFQTLLGGILALAGAMLGPFFQRRHERWKARRDDEKVLRDKAEELFDELDRVSRQAGQASVRSLQMIKDKSLEALPVPDLGKIRAIVVMYFPDAMQIIERFENSHSEATKGIFDSLRKSLESGRDNPDEITVLGVMLTTTFQSLASKYVQEMRAAIADSVPLLHLERVGK